jgi:membrane protease YdiL (CAAX protease family)
MPLSQSPGSEAAPDRGPDPAPATGPVPFSVLYSGPPRYRAVTPWGAAEALAMTFVIAFGPSLLALPLVLLVSAGGGEAASGMQQMTLASPIVLAVMAGTQLVSIAAVWLLAGRAGMRPDTLQFRQPPLQWAACVAAGLLIVAATALLELAMHAASQFDPFAETRMLIEGLRSPYWLGTVFVAVVLAPVWEELVFRGFLLTALAKSRLGIVGGGLICNLIWTAMHFQYSLAGMASVFTAGVMLTWIMWRTASIRACIVAHAVINATSLAFLAWFAPV